MPIAFPVSEIIDEAIELLGNCDKTKAYAKIGRAVEVLANEGEWDILTKQADICTLSDGCTITLPREIRTPLAVNIEGTPLYFRNKWYEFHYNGSGTGVQVPWAWDGAEMSPCFMDIINSSPLIAVADLKTDLSAQLRIFGYDSNGNWIRSQQPDGTWIDGFYQVINLLTDFPFSIIVADSNRRFIRNFTPTPVTDLLSSVNHDLTTGAAVVLSLINAPMPTPLVSGSTYYARVTDSTHVSLHTTRDGALTNSQKVTLTSVSSASILKLTDTRKASVLTKFNSASAHNQRDGLPISFSATTMPSPLTAGKDYYTHVLDDNNFTVHNTAEEATSNINPIDVTTPGTAVVASARQDIVPITHLDFSVVHNYTTGDAVKAVNSTGTLPSPLLPEVTYYVKYVSSTRVTLHSTLADATTGANPVVLLSSGSGPTRLVKTIPCSVNIGSSNNISCQGHGLTIRPTYAALATSSRARASNVATIVMPTPHGLATGDIISMASMGGSDYNTSKATVTVTNTTTFTYPNVGANEGTTGDTNGRVTKFDQGGDLVQFTTSGTFPAGITQDTAFRAEPAMSADSFTLYTTAIDPVNITTAGSGQLYLVISRVFTIGFNSVWKTVATKITTGSIVRFTSTGTLPSTTTQINTTTDYFARKIDDNTIQIFTTAALANDSTIRASTNRSRSANVATITSTAHGLTTGDFVDTSGFDVTRNGVLTTCTITGGGAGYTEAETATITDGTGHTAKGQLTVAAGAITAIRITDGGTGFTVAGALTVTGDSSGAAGATVSVATVTNGVQNATSAYNATRVQITVTGANTFTFPSVGLNEPSTADTGGQIKLSNIKVSSVGTGTVSLVFNRTVTALPFSSLMKLDSNQYLTTGGTIRFETDGTLPAPLALATDYKLDLSGGYLLIRDTLNNQVTLTGIGSGNHTMVIGRNFTTPLPTSFVVSLNNYSNGDKVKGETTGSLPSPLVTNTDYYIRRLSDNTIELYDTEARAKDTASTTGRISPTNVGSGTNTLVQILAAYIVKRITRITKSATNGFIKLYAWDSGRSTALTLIGNYYPDESEPMYRRIKVKTCCPWVRIAYKEDTFKITSDNDLIPIPSKQAVLFMIKALQLSSVEFSQEYETFKNMALDMVTKAQGSLDGPDAPTMQVNDGVFTNPAAQRMDIGWGWNGPF